MVPWSVAAFLYLRPQVACVLWPQSRSDSSHQVRRAAPSRCALEHFAAAVRVSGSHDGHAFSPSGGYKFVVTASAALVQWPPSPCVSTFSLRRISGVLNEGSPSWPHLNVITPMKTVPECGHFLRCWGLEFQHTFFEVGSTVLLTIL